MRILLLPLVFLLLFCVSVGTRNRIPDPDGDWRPHFLRASLWMAAFLVLLGEGLSLLRLLDPLALTLGWSILAVSLAVVNARRGWPRPGLQRLWESLRSLGRCERVALTFVVTVLLLLLVTAWLSPPNNTDSLQYHMARVVHWAQNRSLAPYATQLLPQVVNPIGAELAILNARALAGSDHPDGLVQWWSLVGSLVAASYLARLLGADRRGQWVTVAFVISLPMGIMQATSTQNDFVVAFWTLCLAWKAIAGWATPYGWQETLESGLALGLGLVTKGTFYPFALPWIVLLGSGMLRHRLKRGVILNSLCALALPVILLNAGVWTRNWNTFGTPLGPPAWVSNMANRRTGVSRIASVAVLNVLLNFATPSQELNTRVETWALAWLPIDSDTAESFKLVWGWNHEDLAGNPLHMLIIAGSILALLLCQSKPGSGLAWAYLLSSLSVFALQAAAIHFDAYGVRYQLSFLVSWGPVLGVAITRTAGRRLAVGLTVMLLLSSLPWVLFNRTRPLIGMKRSPEPLSIPCLPGLGCDFGSLLLEPPSRILFANWTYLRGPFEEMTGRIAASGCRSVGLMLDSHDPEYLFWWLLGAPESGVRIEHLRALPELSDGLASDFTPCAVICTTCGQDDKIQGLRYVSDYSGASLFLLDVGS